MEIVDPWMTGIQDMDQKIRKPSLLQRRLKGFNQSMRQVPDESDGVSQEQSLSRREIHATSRCIKRRETSVLVEDLGARELLQKRRLADVCIADDRSIREWQTLTLFTLRCTTQTNYLKSSLQAIDMRANQATVRLELCFTFAFTTQATSLAAEMAPSSG